MIVTNAALSATEAAASEDDGLYAVAASNGVGAGDTDASLSGGVGDRSMNGWTRRVRGCTTGWRRWVRESGAAKA